MTTQTEHAVEILRACCADSEGRFEIGKPWIDGEYAYATDGRILVRVPVRLLTEERREYYARGDRRCPRNVATDFHWGASDFYVPQPIAIDGFSLPPAGEPCDECEGIGKVVCTKCDREDAECETCKGTGTLEEIEPIKVSDDVVLSSHYVRILREHGVSCVYRPVDNERIRRPVRFEGDGFDGVLMQMSAR